MKVLPGMGWLAVLRGTEPQPASRAVHSAAAGGISLLSIGIDVLRGGV
jgi:hypothetical protein